MSEYWQQLQLAESVKQWTMHEPQAWDICMPSLGEKKKKKIENWKWKKKSNVEHSYGILASVAHIALLIQVPMIEQKIIKYPANTKDTAVTG